MPKIVKIKTDKCLGENALNLFIKFFFHFFQISFNNQHPLELMYNSQIRNSFYLVFTYKQIL